MSGTSPQSSSGNGRSPGPASEPLVSIVLPTRDPGIFFEEAVRSVLEQSHRELELLIVDDGSSTPVAATWKTRLSDPRIRWLRTTGLGPGPNLDFGISQARGDLFAFIGDDDRWSEEFVGHVVQLLLESPELDAVASSYRLIDTEGELVNEVIHPRRPLFSKFFYQAEGWQIPMGLVALRRRALAKVSPTGNPSPCADYDWVLGLTIESNMELDKGPWIDLRIHSAQMSVARRERVLRDMVQFLRQRVRQITLAQLAPRLEEPVARMFLAGLFKFRGDHEKALRELEAAERAAALPLGDEWRRLLEAEAVEEPWQREYFALQRRILFEIDYFHALGPEARSF